MVTEEQEKIIVTYNQRFPHTVSMFIVDSLDDIRRAEVAEMMREALNVGKPLSDKKVFPGMSPDRDY